MHNKFLFSDPDAGDYIDVVYMIEDDGDNPEWIWYHGSTYSVVGVAPEVTDITTYRFFLWAYDKRGPKIVYEPFYVTVYPNVPPQLANGTQSIKEEYEVWTYSYFEI